MSSLEYRPIFLIVFTVAVFFFSSTFVLAHAEWYDDSWEYRKKITLSLNTVISNDLTDFPVLISVTDPDLVQTNEALGRDIVFTTSDGTTKLFHEVERFDNTTGEIVAWVNFPTLSAASTTDIYMYYKGNTVGYNSADVWNDDYVVVWHLNQTSTGTSFEFKDATDNGNDGRGGGGTDVGHSMARIPHLTNGQIGYGQQLKGPTTTSSNEGSGDFIYRNSLNGMPSRDFTIELWVGDIVNVPSGGNVALYNDMVSVCYDAGSTNNQYSNHISLWRAENVKMKIRTSFFVSTASPGHPVQDNNPAAFTNWNHIVAVYNQKDADGTAGNSQLYINGVLVKDENRSGNLDRAIQTDKLRLVLGGDIDAEGANNCGRVNNELKGKVDEFRISSGLRTADYAAASYYNQGDPSSYLTLGAEETVPTPTYVVDLLDVYESSSTTLDSGTAICTDVDLESESSCGTGLESGKTYRFEIEVDNRGTANGSPTDFDYLDLVATSDVFGSITSGDITDYGCGTNTDWSSLSVASGHVSTAVGTGTACEITTSGNVEYWVIVTIDSDSSGGTGTFYVDDGSLNDTSTITTFVTFTEPTYVVDLLDVYESSSTTLDSGTAICTDVDLESESSCGTGLESGKTYRFEIEVDNRGTANGSPTDFDYLDLVATSDVFGSITSGDITDYGCGTNTDWSSLSVASGHVSTAVGTGTACEITTSGNVEYWVIVTIDSDSSGGTGTFYVDDGSLNDTSTITTFVTPEEDPPNGSGCYNCTPPTMGYRDDDSFVRVVEDGFVLNKVPFEVEHYAQSGTLVYTKTGAENHIQLKIYEDHGIENISTAIVFLALDEPDVYRNLVCLIWENTWDQKKSLTVLDKYGLVSDAHGDFEIDDDQLILNYYFKKTFPIPESTIGVELRDHHKNMKRYYFENVFEVLGKPLIPTDGLIIQDNTVENFVRDTFDSSINSNNDDANSHLAELYKNYSHELNIIQIIDTSKLGFSEKLTQKYLERIDNTIEQNNLQLLQSKEPLIDDSESEILQTEPPRVEDSLLKSEELRALQVIDEITGRGVLMNSNGGIHNWDDNQTIFVPDWVKNNAKQWSDGLISDEQFSKGLEFLSNENILNKNPNSKSEEYGFPIWVKQYAGFYGDGKVSDTEFLDTFNYLIENDIISIRSD